MEVAILALGRVLPELLSRPLRAAGHEVTIYRDVRSFTGAVRARRGGRSRRCPARWWPSARCGRRS